MTRRYYSSRNQPRSIGLEELYWNLQHLYLFFRGKDYFKGRAGIDRTTIPDQIKHKAALAISFQAFPITTWKQDEITEEHVFDVIEFLDDHISKPGERVGVTDDTGFNYYDYDDYGDDSGRKEFREHANTFLCDYGTGFELAENAQILATGEQGLDAILHAEIPPYDEKNVDSKVRDAILKWRNRDLDLKEKKQAIRELADVFEWLRRTKRLGEVLDRSDENDLFNLANNFAIGHHDPRQKRNYDERIWYAWMFHFYLATYHAAVRLLLKYEKKRYQTNQSNGLAGARTGQAA